MAGLTRGRSLCVGLVAPPALAVPPQGYGGVERVVATLAESLESQGISVRVAAAGGLAGGFRHPVGLDLPPSEANAADLLHVARAFELFKDVDVIHDHTKIAGTALASFASAPVVTT
ncbi:MAG: glycosyltransferase, partial [Cyanobacteria bacterium REEB65]|nr:glycosyltransferase [Cyanobacteria bacterium REEB65]